MLGCLKKFVLIKLALLFINCSSLLALDLPSSVDPGRISSEEERKKSFAPIQEEQNAGVKVSESSRDVPIPPEAEKVTLVLRKIKIVGMKAFNKERIVPFYKQYLNKKITLSVIYDLANKITRMYRDEGYIFSLAYLPPQRIKEGIATIKVLEAYIGKVDLPEKFKSNYILDQHIAWLLKRPLLKIAELESFVLHLNDLAGYTFSSTLAKLDEAKDGGIKLILEAKPKKFMGRINFDNYSSRFVGPNEMSVSHTMSLLPLHQTTISGLSGAATIKRLSYIALNHSVAIIPNTFLELAGNFSKSKPGYTLEVNKITSNAQTFNAGLSYQLIRQRMNNLNIKLGINIRNSNSFARGLLFTRDRIRSLKCSATYDHIDQSFNYNAVSLTFTHGIRGLAANKPGDLNLSRANTRPDFKKFECSLSRLQKITNNWSITLNVGGQYADSGIFSSEEFGYGGQVFGKAFDNSEITGEHGLAAAVQLDYNGWRELPDLPTFAAAPYAYYDIGKVWRRDHTKGKPKESAASIGFGVHLSHKIGSAHLGLAWPLSREITTPIYGQGSKDPRILFQVAVNY